MKNVVLIAISIVLGVGCKSTFVWDDKDPSEMGEMNNIKRLSKDVFDIDPGKPEREGAQANLAGFRTGTTLVSKRTDSRTFFVHDEAAGFQLPKGVFEGDNKVLKGRLEKIFEKLGIPKEELLQMDILQENYQAGKLADLTSIDFTKPKSGQKILKALRKVGGTPVFSSSATLILNKTGGIAFLELHWPLVSEEALREARLLQNAISQRKWKAPAIKGAEPESVEAGIIHSSATAQVLDLYPVIRVIYRPSDETVGKKPVYYYNRYGTEVVMPREFAQYDLNLLQNRKQ